MGNAMNNNMDFTGSSSITEALAKLKENPEILNNIASALGMESSKITPTAIDEISNMINPDNKNPPQSNERSEGDEASDETVLSESSHKGMGISPELISKLPFIMSMISGSNTGSIPTIKKNPEDERRTALLKALKPYMNSQRRDAIDKIIGISELGSMLGRR